MAEKEHAKKEEATEEKKVHAAHIPKAEEKPAEKAEAPKEKKVAPKKEAVKKPALKKEPAKKEEKVEEKKVHAPKAEEKPAEKAEAPKEAPPKKAAKKKKSKVALAKGKRKESVARAVVSPGKGRFVFNRILFDAIPNKYIREIVKEPLGFIGAEISTFDVRVSVRGGGQMGQAQAARTAIAKALVEYLGDEKLKTTYLEHDRSLLVDDVRRVEPKKYKGPKARARFQKSYR